MGNTSFIAVKTKYILVMKIKKDVKVIFLQLRFNAKSRNSKYGNQQRTVSFRNKYIVKKSRRMIAVGFSY